MSKNYDERIVISQLSKKADLRIEGRQIKQLKKGRGDVGNGSKGKIDFLIKYCGYTHMWVN